MNKECFRCKQKKQLSDFNNEKARKDGLNIYCKSCISAYGKVYRKANPLKLRNKELKKVFGITLEQFEKMEKEQESKCKICGKPELANKKFTRIETRKLAVDHCHKTNKIRGLLCHRCNTAIGLLLDDPEIVMKAYTYLKDA